MSKRDTQKKRTLADVPKAAAQRWWRIRWRKWAHVWARAIARRRLPKSEREHRKALDATFEEIKKWAIRSEGGRFKGTATLFNIGLYLLLAYKDIQALKIDALTHPDEWTRKLHARPMGT